MFTYQVCMIFVFVSILEFIIVTVYLRSGRKSLGDKVDLDFGYKIENIQKPKENKKSSKFSLNTNDKLIQNQVEEVSKIVIPLLFCAFNTVYWPIILVKYFDGK